MELTRSGEYGILGMIFLASQPPNRLVHLKEISEAQRVPESFLAKIFRDFAKAGLVKSQRGANGGFMLSQPAEKITLKDIIEAAEGPIFLNRCLLKESDCERMGLCSIYPHLLDAQNKMLEVLENTSLKQLSEESITLAASVNS